MQCVSTLSFFFHSWVVLYVHFYLLLCVFSVCVSEASMFPKDISLSPSVPESGGFVNLAWKCWLGYSRMVPKLWPLCWRSGPQLPTSETYASKLTSSCLEQCRFRLCVRIHRHSNPTAAGSITAVHSWFCVLILLTLPSVQNPPEVWRSMQLIYCSRRCNMTGIQETVSVLMAFRLTAFQFSSLDAKACFSSCPPLSVLSLSGKLLH